MSREQKRLSGIFWLNTPLTVGTRGGVEWMRGPGACPRGLHVIRHEYHVIPTASACHEDKHQAPTPPHIRPLSLMNFNRQDRYQSVILSAAKNLPCQAEILRCAQ